MSLLPYILDDLRCPHTLDQHFGISLRPEVVPLNENHPNFTNPCHDWFHTSVHEHDPESTVTIDKDKFEASLDVRHYSPDEITVKVCGEDTVKVEAKHGEKRDEHGYISRHFVRRYVLPEGHNIDEVAPRLSLDGVLTITAPKVNARPEERTVPIYQTGVPSTFFETRKGMLGQGDKKQTS